MNAQPVRTAAPRTGLGEGPRLDAASATLSWVDITSGRLWLAGVRPDAPPGDLLAAPRLLLGLPGNLGCAVRAGEGEDWLLGHGAAVLRWRPGTDPVPVLGLEPDEGRAHLNDGAVAPDGRFWIGSMSAVKPLRPWGRLHAVDAGRTPPTAAVLHDGLLASNGIGWSPDGSRAYVVDSGHRVVHRLRQDGRGGLIPDGPALEVAGGVPDGLTVDDEGGVWVALWDGAAVVRFDAEGAERDRIPFPCSRPTACALVGTRLVVTTARVEGEEASGWTYAVDVGVGGPAARRAALAPDGPHGPAVPPDRGGTS
ncbi:SMP-30/gluconolactonase/LRE family protein [Streptomyces sp. NPDC002057]|uniref:SMP-30/gluconolactonase/LRE family protein n=1 Tax=Streptomyces sp. NPDC002057 TaxID=3154664 RepID=UPI00332CB13D